jgi:hypothetical protein
VRVRLGSRFERFLALAIIAVCCSATAAWSYDAQLGWAPVAAAAGYKVYSRQSGTSYGAGTDVGNPAVGGDGEVHYVATGMQTGVTNYFAVTAYSSSGTESVLSNELPVTMAASPTPSASGSTATATPVSTSTATGVATSTATATPAVTSTATRTMTSTATAANSSTPVNTPTATGTPAAINSATPTPVGGTIQCGNTGKDGEDATGNDNYAQGPPCTTGVNGSGYSVDSCAVWVRGAPSGSHIRCALYAENGTRLCTSGEVTKPADGWLTIDLSTAGCGTLSPSTRYWLAWNNDSGSIVYGTHSAGQNNRYAFSAYATAPFPDPWGAADGGYQFAMYVNLRAVGGSATAPPTSTATNTLTATPTASMTNTATASASATPTRTLPPTATATSSASPTATNTATATRTATASQTASATNTATASASATPTRTLPPTATATNSASPTSSSSATATRTASATATNTPPSTSTATASQTASATNTATASASATPTRTLPPTATATNSVPPTSTSSATATRTASATATNTAPSTSTATASQTASATNTPLPTNTTTATSSATPTRTLPPTATATNSVPPTSTSSATATRTASTTATNTAPATSTATASRTASATNTAVPTNTATATQSATPSRTLPPTATTTSSASATATATASTTGTPSVTATGTVPATSTATVTQSASPTPTASTTGTATATDTPPPTASATTPPPTASATGTAPPTASVTASATRTATPTDTALPTSTATATYTVTPIPTATVTSTATASPPPTATATGSASSTATPSPTGTPTVAETATSPPPATASASQTATETASPAPSATDTPSPIATASQTATAPGMPAATATDAPSPDLEVATATPADSGTPTSPPTPLATSTDAPTVEPTATRTDAPVPAATATATATDTEAPSPTASATPVDTASPTATTTAVDTASATATASATITPTATAAATATDTPVPTATVTPSPTATAVPDWNVSLSTDVRGMPGTTASVPLTIAAGSGVRRFAVRVTFDSSVVTAQDVQLSGDVGAGTVDRDLSTPGEVTVTGTLLQPMTAAGALADITFLTVGQCPSSTLLTITSCSLDGGAIGCRPNDGQLRVRCGVGGRVRHLFSAEPVAGATVAMSSVDTTAMTSTNELGQFSFPEMTSGTWQLEPQKTGDFQGAITALDAAIVLQAAAGYRQLDPMQALACDVTGNGHVTPLDAARILQFAVHQVARLPIAETCASDWAFVPDPIALPNERVVDPLLGETSCQHGSIVLDPLLDTAPEQDFAAVLFGDCSGNWLSAAQRNARLRVSRDMHVRVGAARPRGGGGQWVVPLYVSSAPPFQGLDAHLAYDPTAHLVSLRPVGAAREAMVKYESAGPNAIALGLASAIPLPADGRPVALLVFDAPSRNAAQPLAHLMDAAVDEVAVSVGN